MESALDLLRFRASEKGLELAYQIDAGVPHAISGDVTRLRQIIINLMNNAVKFTEHGEIVLSAAVEKYPEPTDGKGKYALRFSVRDTGIGIPPDRIDNLFKAFSQVDASTSRKYGGTGLGLAICKRLSEMMGGKVWVESELGVGSIFNFTIKVQAAPELIKRAHLNSEQPHLHGRRLLVVDDNATNRRILLLQTQAWGMQTRAAESPAEALDWIRRGDQFDLAILDFQMPEMDGLTLAGEIRKLRSEKTLPLVLFSSQSAHETPRLAGFTAHLSKPLKPSALFDVLMNIFASKAGASTGAAPAAGGYKMDIEMGIRLPLRILLAEDNIVNQKLALRLLVQMGYRADVAANGIEVIESLQRQMYDVILMDVQMPEMDGLEASRRICALWPRDERPQIIAMTANAMQGDREMCLDAGMDDYVSKPIRVEELVTALSKVIPHKQRS
jgi:CheY-like chemotaxis protein